VSSCSECIVRNRAICASLAPAELEALNRLGRRQTVKRGQTLMWEGDESMLVANVVEGVLKLSTSTGDGREQIVGVVYPSDFIGRPFGSRSHHTVTALTDAKVCMFTRSGFDGGP
jgi:CRP/FNR family transcriptional regulator